MRSFLLLVILLFPVCAFSTHAPNVDHIRETTILLKHRNASDVIPFLKPHLAEDGRISGLDKSITIKSHDSNIDELMIIIGDLDRMDYMQLIISITMNINAVHNINTRSLQVGANTWTKISYGISYSKRFRETLVNGHLVEKIKYVKVIESFQIYTKIDKSHKKFTLKLRLAEDDSTDIDEQPELNPVEVDELADNTLEIKIPGKMNEWIHLGDAIKLLYVNLDEDPKTSQERQQLTSKMGIKIQLLQ
jgi:hypothetical protein